MGKFNRGDIVLVPYPFVTTAGEAKQKLRPAIVVSKPDGRRFRDLSLVAITSRIPAAPSETEIVLSESDASFGRTGLKVSSTIRTEAIMTIPENLIIRAIGASTRELLMEVEKALLISLDMNRAL